MSLPAGITTCTLTAGAAKDFFGNDGTTKLDVTPIFGGNAKELTWGATGEPMLADTASSTGGVGSSASVQVPHVNQSGFVDSNNQAATMWSYRCVITAVVGTTTQTWVKNVQPLVGQTSVDLDLVPDGAVTPPTSAPFPPVLSVNGMTGNVVVSGGSGGGAVDSVNGRTGSITLAKADVGLNNVDNTADLSKPVSVAQSTAINARALDSTVVHNSGAEPISGQKTFAVSPIGPTPTTGQTTALANVAFVLANGGGTSAPDADASTKGLVQLAGDLSGTAALPTVPSAVKLTGNQTIAGIKTHTSSPVVPTATTSGQAANLGNVTAALAAKFTGTAGELDLTLVPDLPTNQVTSGVFSADLMPVGSTLTVYKSGGGSWPARPTANTGIIVQWVGVAPSPVIGGAGGAVNGVDLWIEDAS